VTRFERLVKAGFTRSHDSSLGVHPWPDLHMLRQDYGKTDPITDRNAVLRWPFVVTPDPSIIDEYTRTQTSQANPLLTSS